MIDTTAELRKRNTLKIIRIIKNSTRISRPGIARKTRLSNVTVGTLITSLLNKNIIIENGLADSNGGRKALEYSINKDAGKIIGVAMELGMISLFVFDLMGNQLAEKMSVLFDKDDGVEKTVYLMKNMIEGYIKDNDLEKHDIWGIGITVPGRVDYLKGIVFDLPNLIQWRNVPLKEMLQGAIGIPVFIDKSLNARLEYLKWNSFPDEESNMVFIMIDDGIGASLMIEGSVYHGEHGMAGEVGHISLDPNGPLCNCGNNGCIEVFASNSAIIRYYFEELEKAGKDTSECKEVMGEKVLENEYILKIAKRVAKGDKEANIAFYKAVLYLKVFLADVVYSYDVAVMIIVCNWAAVAVKYFNEMVSGMFARVNQLDRNDIRVLLNTDTDVVPEATYIVVIERLLSDEEDNILKTINVKEQNNAIG